MYVWLLRPKKTQFQCIKTCGTVYIGKEDGSYWFLLPAAGRKHCGKYNCCYPGLTVTKHGFRVLECDVERQISLHTGTFNYGISHNASGMYAIATNVPPYLVPVGYCNSAACLLLMKRKTQRISGYPWCMKMNSPYIPDEYPSESKHEFPTWSYLYTLSQGSCLDTTNFGCLGLRHRAVLRDFQPWLHGTVSHHGKVNSGLFSSSSHRPPKSHTSPLLAAICLAFE